MATLEQIPTKKAKKNKEQFVEEGKTCAMPVKPPVSPKVTYRKKMEAMIKKMQKRVEKEIIPILERSEAEYVGDDDENYEESLSRTILRILETYSDIAWISSKMSGKFVSETEKANRIRFVKSMKNAVGINLKSVVKSERLGEIMKAVAKENVSLIKSIPSQYFKKIETIVYEGITQGSRARSMVSEIRELGKTTKSRAHLIARDQTAKLNSALSRQRQIDVGVTEYVWRTAKDGRVRKSHKRNNGKIFKWNSPPKTGHPGTAIQCRCVAQPIIKI